MLLDRKDQAISSTDLQKKARSLLDHIANGTQDRYVVMRDNRPTAVMLSTARYEALLDELEDLKIEAVARERLASLREKDCISFDEMKKHIENEGDEE